jgi:hypothetical protein
LTTGTPTLPDFGLPLLGLGGSTWAAVVLVGADVAALTSIWRSRAHAVRAKVIWTTVVALLPVLGAIAWFALGRERRGGRRGR